MTKRIRATKEILASRRAALRAFLSRKIGRVSNEIIADYLRHEGYHVTHAILSADLRAVRSVPAAASVAEPQQPTELPSWAQAKE